MVDEQFSNIDASQRQNLRSSSTCTDNELDYNDQGISSNDFNSKLENGINSIQYEASTSSPESTNENVFSFNGCKFNSTSDDKNNEKKVHWNPSQVHVLLDCIEKRMSDFRRKSVHKSVWLSIGKEMSEHGDFTVEHCYNKWKNLRRDIRLFSNTNSMQKLSIRNTYIMERVQRMVNDIGYEGSSRKSSSPISPNFDGVQPNDNGVIGGPPNKELWNAYSTIDLESRKNIATHPSKPDQIHVKIEKTHQPKPALDQNHFSKIPLNGEPIGPAAIEDSILSLLSDPAVSQAILMNPKLLDEILPGLDFSALIKKFVDAHPELVHVPPVIGGHMVDQGMTAGQFTINGVNNVSLVGMTMNSHGNHNNVPIQKKPPSLNAVPHLFHNNDVNNSWPHQLYELLHNFRDEESRQMARLDQIVGYVQVMQDSTKKRLSTINQLISLAGMLIPQK